MSGRVSEVESIVNMMEAIGKDLNERKEKEKMDEVLKSLEFPRNVK